ncbi:hypothetical protein H0H92_002850 [Tricholoma furcatifolium]|nr:hypothetical protein H0H92_002850 [Tricholoma furcatifolium]
MSNMVVSTPLPANNGPAHDNEKRRKQTMERARANHLSRQLQMRLQYARLKVDHGWQKQNLNEVENLYFHHSHQRGSKASPTIAPANLNVLLSSASPSTSTGTHSHVIDSPGQSKPSKPPSPLTQSYTIASPPRNPQDDNQTSSSASSFQFASTSSQSSGQQQLSPAISINPST